MFWVLSIGLILAVLAILFANWKIPHDSKGFVYDEVDSIPPQKAALVLGAAKNIGNRPNLYFTYRIQAAKELYDAGKVQVFVVSGDNSRKDYNEADDMRAALVEAGVPDSIIPVSYTHLDVYKRQMQILILILTYPIYYFTLSIWGVLLTFLFCYLYQFWVYIQLFRKNSPIKTVCKTLASMVLSFLFVVIASSLVTFVFIFINHR